MQYRFADFVLDLPSQELLGPEGPIALRPQAFEVLHLLLSSAPDLVTKEALLDRVWGHRSISESSLAQVIKEIRSGLGDSAEKSQIIATRHRRGYQVVLPVAVVDPDITPDFASPSGDQPFPWRRLGWAFGAGALIAITLVVVLKPLSSPPAAASDGWPTQASARQLVDTALDAAWRFDLPTALTLLGQLDPQDISPRVTLTQARLHTLRGERESASLALAQMRARLPTLHRRDQIYFQAVEHELAGNHHLAVDRYRVLNEMTPQDVDFALALFDVMDAGSEPVYDRLGRMTSVPSARRLLLSAKQAGRSRQFADRVSQANALILTCEMDCPELAALARHQLGLGQRSLGQVEDASVSFAEAATELESFGLLRPAMRARQWQITVAMRSGDLNLAEAGVDDLEQRLGALDDPYLKANLTRMRGHIARRRGRDEEALGYLAAAASEFEQQQNLDELASTLMSHGGPLRRLSRVDDAREVLLRALAVASEAGSQETRGQILGTLAGIYTDQGRYDEAIRYGEQALASFRELGSRNSQAVALMNLAITYSHRGDQAGQKEHALQALELARELGRRSMVALAAINLAVVANAEGDLAAAQAYASESEQVYRALNNPKRMAAAMVARVDTELHRGDIDAARRVLDRMPPLDVLDDGEISNIYTLWGHVERFRGHARAARQWYERALKVRNQRAGRGLIRDAMLNMARLSIDEGRPVQAEQTARQLATEAQSEGVPGAERDARLVLAAALLAQGELAKARTELDTVQRLLAVVPSFGLELEAALLRARADGAGHSQTERLGWVISRADSAGFRRLALEAEGMVMTPESRAGRWQEEVNALDLGYLLAPRVVLGDSR
ncbi:MAG: tetratricopeptide repeat protein [Pseudomonadota bacterium]